MVLRNMRYSKLEISLLCHRCVMLEDLKSCLGVAKEIRLRGGKEVRAFLIKVPISKED